MKGVLEDHNRLTPGEVPRDLHCVLNSLCARVHEQTLLGIVTGRDAIELLTDLDVSKVRSHREARVGEQLHLLDHAINDA